MSYMAGESAAQCGPCVFGLRAIADATERLARGNAEADDLARIERWTGQLAGRGACRHPDGAVGLVASALRVFGDEFLRHARRTCGVAALRGVAA
jgi:NADH:ubiquinone oxidoreductase subunit F (NADH-binding)